MTRIVDLRSDTFSMPTENMMKAIQKAKLGNCSAGEDPTVIELEELAAETFGTEAAMFSISGTMSNLVAAITHTKMGQEVLLGKDAHVLRWEAGSLAMVANLMTRAVPMEYGVMDPADLEAGIRPHSEYEPKTGLLWNENTNNLWGGTAISLKDMKAVYDVGQKHSIPVHTDGARVFNAAVALKTKVKDIARYTDSLSFCLSKGLSCPGASLLVGTEEFIEKAIWNRVKVGGVFRQIGILAACGIVALNEMVDRLEEDHRNLRKLALGLKDYETINIDMKAVQTNIVFLNLTDDLEEEYHYKLEAAGVKALISGKRQIRMVIYNGITDDDIDYALEAAKDVFR